MGVDHYVVEMKRMRGEEEEVDTGEQQQGLTTFLLV